ncbi:MAG: hypothetical protein JXR64_00255 [Spirochaetales bacterium]|nr:hypothetical protein [Spirochaetales bacterium]
MRKKLIISIVTSIFLLFLIYLLDSNLAKFPHLEDQGAAWYFWKLPKATLLGTITSWGGYLIHQIIVFAYIINRKKYKDSSKYTNRFLLLNLFFVVLHIIQTHLFYDGLAQYVPVWSSQYSVIIMLSISLILLQPRRGFILARWRTIPKTTTAFFSKYHGLYISWALIYTFWFHPTEGDIAILIGFAYMFLLFVHMSMLKTKLHTNIKWITVLETFVVIHGVGIALMNKQEIWPMFLTGFLFMFVFTYMYGLGLNKIIRIIIYILYFSLILYLYYFRGYSKIYEVLFIPVTLYGVSLLLLGMTKVFISFKK